MKQICAWCGIELKGTRASRKGTSYGICVPCANGVINNTPALMRDYIDRIECPVALVSIDGVIKMANKGTCTLLQKEIREIEGFPCGEVFRCAGAAGAGSCGSTEECTACEIRRCVLKTHRTGEEVSGVPAHLKQQSTQETSEICWVISTSKFLDCVVLKIYGLPPARQVTLQDGITAAEARKAPRKRRGQRREMGCRTGQEGMVAAK